MKLEDAKTGGDIAASIQQRLDMIATINKLLADDDAHVSQLRVQSGSSEVSLIIDRLEGDVTKQCLNFALQIYQAQVDALTAQLDAI